MIQINLVVIMTSARETLMTCMEQMFRESAQARNAMRDWLDELERTEHRTGVIKVTGTVSPSKKKSFGTIGARFDADPVDYKWKLEKVVDEHHGIFEREFKCGVVKLKYYFRQGIIHLVYPRSLHPKLSREEKNNAQNNGKPVDSMKSKQIVEHFSPDDEQKFKEILLNAPARFGTGVLEQKEETPAKPAPAVVSLPTITVEKKVEPQRQPSPTPVVRAPSITIAQPPKGNFYGGTRAYFDAEPGNYGWGFIEIVWQSRQARYTRSYKFGTVNLSYCYTTGTVQLVYPKWKHPDYAEEELERFERERHDKRFSGRGYYLYGGNYRYSSSDDEDDDVHKPNIVENFRDFTEYEFTNILKNVHNYFGKGYVNLNDY